jgi:hypothetical protein
MTGYGTFFKYIFHVKIQLRVTTEFERIRIRIETNVYPQHFAEEFVPKNI